MLIFARGAGVGWKWCRIGMEGVVWCGDVREVTRRTHTHEGVLGWVGVYVQ